MCSMGGFPPRFPGLAKRTLGWLIFPSSFSSYLVWTPLFNLKGFGIIESVILFEEGNASDCS